MTLISICIPTYNHADYLRRMLERLVSLPSVRQGEVEIVISDNASTDDTQVVGEHFACDYPNLVRYFRNAENVRDANFGLALSRGMGLFLKLANDTLLFSEEGLSEMLESVRRHQNARPVLFFSNQSSDFGREIACASFDELFGEISFHSTWIGSFGIWKPDFDELPDFARARDLKLTQVDVLCRMMVEKGRAVVNRAHFAESMPRGRIGDYNLAKVFGRNYFSILSEYVVGGKFSPAAFKREKFKMLRYHILPFYLTFSSSNGFPKSGYFRWLVRDMWSIPFFWLTLPFVLLVEFLAGVKRMVRNDMRIFC